MNLEYLRYFYELSKNQHYGKTAEELHISQPGLSHAIKALEEEYGIPLFVREGRNVTLSNYGRELAENAARILREIDAFEQKTRSFRSEEKTIRIASVYTFAVSTVPGMIRESGMNFPFIVYNRMTPEIVKGLEEGRYDIGFCSELARSDKLEYYPIQDSYLTAVIPSGHELQEKKSICLADALRYPQVFFSRTSGFRKIQEQAFSQAGLHVEPAYEAEEIEVVIGIVEQGFGISILPYMDVIRHHLVKAIRIRDTSWESRFYIARRKDGIWSQKEDAFFRFCVENAAQNIPALF